jgi:hypothetical protein
VLAFLLVVLRKVGATTRIEVKVIGDIPLRNANLPDGREEQDNRVPVTRRFYV